jgi:hypothetical protein
MLLLLLAPVLHPLHAAAATAAATLKAQQGQQLSYSPQVDTLCADGAGQHIKRLGSCLGAAVR